MVGSAYSGVHVILGVIRFSAAQRPPGGTDLWPAVD